MLAPDMEPYFIEASRIKYDGETEARSCYSKTV